jgi:hypothetical protein
MRRQPRQPPLLDPDLMGPAGQPRQPYDHLVAQPVHRVVGPGGLDPPDRELSPLGELVRHQAFDQRRVDVELVGVHFGRGRHGAPWGLGGWRQGSVLSGREASLFSPDLRRELSWMEVLRRTCVEESSSQILFFAGQLRHMSSCLMR